MESQSLSQKDWHFIYVLNGSLNIIGEKLIQMKKLKKIVKKEIYCLQDQW